MEVGEKIRSLYDDFLGYYREGDVYAYSTAVQRTKFSLEMAIEGLYPKSKNIDNELFEFFNHDFGFEFLSVFVCPR